MFGDAGAQVGKINAHFETIIMAFEESRFSRPGLHDRLLSTGRAKVTIGAAAWKNFPGCTREMVSYLPPPVQDCSQPAPVCGGGAAF